MKALAPNKKTTFYLLFNKIINEKYIKKDNFNILTIMHCKVKILLTTFANQCNNFVFFTCIDTDGTLLVINAEKLYEVCFEFRLIHRS